MRFAFVALLALLSPLSAAALTVTFSPSGFRLLADGLVDTTSTVGVVAGDGGGFPYSTSNIYPTALPCAQAHTASSSVSTSTTIYSLDSAAFELGFEHAAGARYGRGTGALSWANLYFSVDEDVQYVLSGVYAATGPAGFEVVQYAVLFDETAGQFAFFGSQSSDMTPNESFTLGLLEGDSLNQGIEGSLSGALTAGHVYKLEYGNSIRVLADDLVDASSTASAVGNLTLTFVPEPSASALLGVFLAGAMARARLRLAPT